MLLLYQKYNEERNGTAREPELTDLTQLIVDLSKTYTKVFIIIDALDECSQEVRKQRLLASIMELLQDTAIIIIVSSRSEVDIIEMLGYRPSLSLESSKITPDVDLYVRSEIHRKPRLTSLSEDVQEKIIRTLFAGADGM